MASVLQRGKKKTWYAVFRDLDGRQLWRKLDAVDRRSAEAGANLLEATAQKRKSAQHLRKAFAELYQNFYGEAINDELRKNGHLVAEEPLQPANTAVTVSWKNGKVAVTDGPYAETKEQLGGIQVLEARDLNHAIQLISQCPGVKLKCGTIEIRPAVG